MDLAEFLDKRITEDEAARFESDGDGWRDISADRALAECEAKRRIIAHHYIFNASGWCGECETNPCWEQRVLANIWADHPDFDRTWRMPS